jgi:beta-lactamase superfamily II metal-dependent hydrolase
MSKLAVWLVPILILALVLGAVGCEAEEDSDGDGWPDSQEISAGTDPESVDSDGDGYWDPHDPNPLDANIPVAGTATPTPTPTPTTTPTTAPTATPTPTMTPLPPVTPSPTPAPTPAGNETLPELRVHFIDVGQGDAILLDLDETEVLIDGGERDSGVVEYLAEYVDGPLEAMIATHPYADHIGGLVGVMEAYDVQEIWWNGQAYDSQTYSDFKKALILERTEVHVATRGNTTAVGNLTLTVLHPYVPGDDTNNNSVVLLVSYGDTDFLFMGDAQKEAEAELLAQSIVQIPDVDVMKVGHHGSRTSSSPAFLDAVRPEVAVYMAGEGNRYGYPHVETISALWEIEAETYGTLRHGTVVVVTNGVDYSVYRTPN